MIRGRPDFLLATSRRVTLATDPQAGLDKDGRFSCVATIFEQRISRLFFDMILREGCFDRSLSERGLPSCVWSHDWETPPIAATTRCEQVGMTLEADAELFPAETDILRHLRMAMSRRNGDGRATLREFSLGFDIVDARWDVVEHEEVLAVYDAELYEFGPCLVAAVSGTGFLRAPEPDELLSRFPRPGDPSAEMSADARRERGLARAHLL